MKKQIISKVLFACLSMAISGFVLNIQAQDIKLEFTNEDNGDYGSSNGELLGIGLGGSGSGAKAGTEDLWAPEGVTPHVEFAFTIGATGQIGLDVSTAALDPVIIDVLDRWDDPAIGAATNPDLFGKSFSLILTAESRMQLGTGEAGNLGGIGVRGINQRRIDDSGDNNEWMEFELIGDVGIDFVRFGYNDVSSDPYPHMVVIDHDTRGYHPILDGIDGDPHPAELYVLAGDYNMRYFTDMLRFTTEDSINVGYKLWSLEFNVVPAAPKPPAVVSTTPADADSSTNSIADDYIIEWDAAMEQAATAAAVSISPVDGADPAVANVQSTWGAGAMGDMQTLSFDDLEFETWYEVVVGTGALGANGLNKLDADTFTFKTLPEPPSVVSTFPENLAVEVPIDSPISIEFSKSMIDTTVEQSITFSPELNINSFAWSADNSTIYISSDEMDASTLYFATVGADATDVFGIKMTEPAVFAFTTSIATSVEDNQASDFAIYPNPASDQLHIKGMDAASVKVYSFTGQLVKAFYNTNVINVSDIETGLYVISASDKEDNRIRKMVVIE